MLRGHIDVISNAEVSGWAMDNAAPDQHVEIAIYIDGKRTATEICDKPRPERRGPTGRVIGPHGFHFKFPEALKTDTGTRRVTVRYASTGALVGAGDLLLPADAKQVPLDLKARLPNVFFRLPGPMTARAVFDLLAMYDPRIGLYNLLNQIDFTEVAAQGIDYAQLLPNDKLPEHNGGWTPQAAKDRLYDVLTSAAFQNQIIAQMLKLYPEKQRCLFVHIPKCAGSDLSSNLTQRYPAVDRQYANPLATPKPVLFDELGRLVRSLPFSDGIYVRGHVNLSYYESQGLIRPTDRVFTIMRDPIGIAISHVNYILTRFRNDARIGRAGLDTKGWLRVLGMPFEPETLEKIDVVELGRRILREHRIILKNPMCFWLGGGSAEKVLERLARHSVEITNTECYETWLSSRWGIGRSERKNESVKFLSASSLPPEDIDYLHGISDQDEPLFREISDRLRESGATSVRVG